MKEYSLFPEHLRRLQTDNVLTYNLEHSNFTNKRTINRLEIVDYFQKNR